MKKNHPAGRPGFTLVELMVAMSLFVAVMTISTEIFIKSADSQEKSVVSKNVQEGVSFAMSSMVNEMQGAKADPGSCDDACETPGPYYCTAGSSLVFMNAEGNCVAYSLENDVNSVPRLKVVRGSDEGYLTPASLRVNTLKFFAEGQPDDKYPLAKATMYLKMETAADSPTQEDSAIQMTVVSPSIVPEP